MFGTAFWYRERAIRMRAADRRKAIQGSLAPTSSRELKLLAAQSPLMKSKYGAKRVERVFEQQLALVFQSLGFTVVSIRPGEVGADLICISREAKYCFLVDAKSRSASYKLSKADARALEDYASDFATGLRDLPELKFILLVGPSAAKTTGAKLKALEQEVSIPLRFAPARVIADIRDALSGPVIPDLFKNVIVRGDHVLSPDLVTELRDGDDALAATYSTFVDGLRKLSKAQG